MPTMTDLDDSPAARWADIRPEVPQIQSGSDVPEAIRLRIAALFVDILEVVEKTDVFLATYRDCQAILEGLPTNPDAYLLKVMEEAGFDACGGVLWALAETIGNAVGIGPSDTTP